MKSEHRSTFDNVMVKSTVAFFGSQCTFTVWHSGNASVSINEVNYTQPGLVLGWVTVSGLDPQRRHFISVCNQPNQPGTLCGTIK